MYGKLFSSIFDGTLAAEGNWRAVVTFQQMICLADSNGVVDMTPQAISRRTSIPLEIINAGLLALLKPGEESRIVFLDDRPWGWRIVNYRKFFAVQAKENRRIYHQRHYVEKRAVEPAPAEGSVSPLRGFDVFWSAYPLKRNKGDAQRAWKAAKIEEIRLPSLIMSVEVAKRSKAWKKNVPSAAEWIRANTEGCYFMDAGAKDRLAMENNL